MRYFPFLLLFILASCSADSCSPHAGLRGNPEERRPLRPMAYTEYLGATPEGIAVREQRIARALLENASQEEEWGNIKSQRVVDFSTPQKLQQALVKALFTRDERLWDALFIQAEDYISLVHVDKEKAQRFVEEIQAKSLKLWDTFEPDPVADGLPGGFADVFDVEPLDLGHGRSLSGKLLEEGEQGQQFWGSSFILTWRQKPFHNGVGDPLKPAQSVQFKISLPKIIRIRSAGVTKFQLAAPVHVEPSIDLFLKTGIHLKPQLMRSTEYPIPLTVGNYWRYRRYIGEKRSETIDPFKLEVDDDTVMMVDATRAVDEIVRVDDYTHWKLVEILRSHNDTELTKFTRWWLVFPRGIYLCNRYCRQQIKNVASLLDYVSTRVPLYVFPIHEGMVWKAAVDPKAKKVVRRKERQKKDNRAENAGKVPLVKSQEDSGAEISTPLPNQIETSMGEPMTTAAGSFEQIIRMSGPASLDTFPVAESGLIDRDFVWGKGIVRRFSPEENLTEELIEIRVR